LTFIKKYGIFDDKQFRRKVVRKTIIISVIISLVLLSCLSYGKKSGDFRYETSENGLVIIDYEGEERNLIIPEKIDGQTVVGIKSFSLYEYDINFPRFVTLPATIEWINSNAFDYCTNLYEITVVGNADKISGMDALNYSSKLKHVKFVYQIPRIIVKNIFNNDKNKIDLITEISIWKNGYIDRKKEGGELFSIKFNENIVISQKNYELYFSVVKTIGNNIFYLISDNDFKATTNSEILFYNDEQISKEYERILIEETSSNDVFYYGKIEGWDGFWEFCKNSEVLATSEGFFMWDQLFAVSKNGENYAYIKLDQDGRNRNIFLNNTLYYGIDDYYHRAGLVQPLFSPDGRNLAFLEIIETNEGRLYNFYTNNKRNGPYRSASFPSFSFSDDSLLLKVIIWKDAHTYNVLELNIN
jgi:hypothetical protein